MEKCLEQGWSIVGIRCASPFTGISGLGYLTWGWRPKGGCTIPHIGLWAWGGGEENASVTPRARGRRLLGFCPHWSSPRKVREPDCGHKGSLWNQSPDLFCAYCHCFSFFSVFDFAMVPEFFVIQSLFNYPQQWYYGISLACIIWTQFGFRGCKEVA